MQPLYLELIARLRWLWQVFFAAALLMALLRTLICNRKLRAVGAEMQQCGYRTIAAIEAMLQLRKQRRRFWIFPALFAALAAFSMFLQS